jgi:phenylacetate-CoA ligase
MNLITRISYRIAESVVGGFQLGQLKREISRSQYDLSALDDRLKRYLSKWNLGEKLINVPIQYKEDILRLAIDTNAYSKAYKFAYTGGSTGIPLKVPLSRKQDIVRKASFSFYNSLVGYELGVPYIFIRVKDRGWLEKKLRREHAFLPQDISDVGLRELCDAIERHKAQIIIGHPSVLTELAESLINYNTKKKFHRILGIITCSEPLFENQVSIISEVFPNAKILSRYSNEEVGVLAHQTNQGGPLITEKFTSYIEVVNPQTFEPVRQGKAGLVLVTDLFSEYFPVCRYSTGDIAVVEEFNQCHVVSLKQVNGRLAEQIFSSNKQPVSSLLLGTCIYRPLLSRGIMCRYQFIQTGEGAYKVNFSCKVPENSPDVRDDILMELRRVLGNEADIEFTYGEDIVKRDSGKTPIYVNQMLEDNHP